MENLAKLEKQYAALSEQIHKLKTRALSLKQREFEEMINKRIEAHYQENFEKTARFGLGFKCKKIKETEEELFYITTCNFYDRYFVLNKKTLDICFLHTRNFNDVKQDAFNYMTKKYLINKEKSVYKNRYPNIEALKVDICYQYDIDFNDIKTIKDSAGDIFLCFEDYELEIVNNKKKEIIVLSNKKI